MCRKSKTAWSPVQCFYIMVLACPGGLRPKPSANQAAPLTTSALKWVIKCNPNSYLYRFFSAYTPTFEEEKWRKTSSTKHTSSFHKSATYSNWELWLLEVIQLDRYTQTFQRSFENGPASTLCVYPSIAALGRGHSPVMLQASFILFSTLKTHLPLYIL